MRDRVGEGELFTGVREMAGRRFLVDALASWF